MLDFWKVEFQQNMSNTLPLKKTELIIICGGDNDNEIEKALNRLFG